MQADIKQLIDYYAKAQQNLINIISEKEARGNVTAFQKSLLVQINEELQRLAKYSYDWSNSTIENIYKKTVEDVNKQMSKMDIELKDFNSFSLLHAGAIKIISKNCYNDLEDAINWVGRRMIDNIRKAGLDVTANKIAAGETVKEAKRNLVDRLINEGITGVKTKTGRVINLASYGELVARSTTREATNRATVNQLTANGYDLVKMSNHNSSCPVCAAYEGRVYSISGKDMRFPRLNKAYSGVYANIHPNCRHVLMPYVEAFNDTEKDREFSNRSFDIDSRSQAEIDRYNKEQAEKTKLRTDRQQWQRYKLSMPNETPNFASFRRIKNSNSEKYHNLLSNYRSLRQGGEGTS